MRTDTSSGLAKWAKVFKIKNFDYNSVNHDSVTISSDQVGWFIFNSTLTPFVYRIADNGTIIQVICLGPQNLSFGSRVMFLSVLSETEFLTSLEISVSNSQIGVSNTSGTDFSIARISTDLSLK